MFVDHTTASAGIARELAAEADKRGFGFVDAPVSGGEQGAKNGQLTIMCGGARSRLRQGRAGHDASMPSSAAGSARRAAGQLTKMVNQICIAGLVQALSEGLSFARAAGLDPQAVVEVISKGAAQSWQMENRHKTMLAGHYDHGFAVEWMRKDLGICLDEARRNGAALPVTALVDQFYAEVESHGRQALGYLQPVRAHGSAREGAHERRASPAKPYHHGDLRNALARRRDGHSGRGGARRP